MTSCTERGDSRIKFERSLSALDLWIGTTNAMMAVDSAENYELYQAVTGARYLLTGPDYPNPTGHNLIEVRERRSPVFFILVSGSEGICLLVCSIWQTDLYY